MKAEKFKTQASYLIERISDLISQMPDMGDTKETSQKICLTQALGELYMCVNGTEPEDFIDLEHFFETQEFNLSIVEEGAEIETWTNGGVNMIICLEPFTIQSFHDYVREFDIDEEINLHRQDERYRNDFTLTQSLKDFNNFYKRLKTIDSKLRKLTK